MNRLCSGLACALFMFVFLAARAQDWLSCIDAEYGISFRYPSNWSHGAAYADRTELEGPDGSVQINASEGTSPAIVCHGDATHKLRPYGTHPRIEFLKFQGRRSYIVWPSPDQGAPHLAELVVEYPAPITIRGSHFSQLILYADKDHFRAIIDSVRFIPAAKE